MKVWVALDDDGTVLGVAQTAAQAMDELAKQSLDREGWDVIDWKALGDPNRMGWVHEEGYTIVLATFWK